MKKIVILFILLVSFVGCKKEKTNTENLDHFIVSYSLYSGWINYSAKATINQNGALHVIEKNGLLNKNRELSYHISKAEIEQIKEKLNNIMVINIKDKYGFDNENAPTDLPVTIFSYKTSSKTDSTSIYFPKENELPIELESFLKTVTGIIVENDTCKSK